MLEAITAISGNFRDTMQMNLTQLGIDQHISPWLLLLCLMGVIVLVCVTAFYATRFALLRSLDGLLRKGNFTWLRMAKKHRVFHRVVWLVPLMIAYMTIPLIEISHFPLVTFMSFGLQMAFLIAMIFVGVLTINAFLNSMEESYRHLAISKQYSIKSYLQVVKIFIYVFAAILMVSVLFDQSPVYFLTGLGAMTAVVMLIFKDSILGFVASIQMTAYDILRVGDWVEIPSFGADGTVIDISLNTIKIQNFDNTIVTIPSYVILTNGVKNWRGMKESGGRRIKRSFFVDVNSIKFCDAALLEKLSKIGLLHGKIKDLVSNGDGREHVHADIAALTKIEHCVSNLTLFRAYLEEYLRKHPLIHPGMTFLVRELQDQGAGIPVELYIFTSDTNWNVHERVQAEIFDHIFAIMPLFDLSAFQHLSGAACSIKAK